MGRRPLEIGTWGTIRTTQLSPKGVKPEVWRAITQFRDRDGRTRQVERQGASRTKAEDTLKAALVKRAGTGALTADSTFEAAALVWLDKVEVQDTSHDTYRRRLHSVILPKLGQVRIRECDPGRISGFLRELRPKYAATTRRQFRLILAGVLQEATEAGLLDHNPCNGIRVKGGATRKAFAYDTSTVLDFLAKLDTDEKAKAGDLPDFLRFLFGTGVRYGEALAVRWCDLNLTDLPVRVRGTDIPAATLWVNGNIVQPKGKGLVRHDGKTFRANRLLGLPDFLVTMLLVRRPVGAKAADPVFPNGVGGWRAPQLVQRQTRKLRARIGYEEFHTHVARKTVATILDGAGHSARKIADQLGHAQVSTTQNDYMGRGQANPQAAADLGQIYGGSK